MSNEKQIGLGLMQYTQDYDERTVSAYAGGGFAAIRWNMVIQPYLKSMQVLVCPSDSSPVKYGGSYTYSGFARDPANADSGVLLAAIQLPAQSPIMADAVGYNSSAQVARNAGGDANPQCMVFLTPSSPTNGGRDLVPPAYNTWTSLGNETAVINTQRHMDGSNYLFADGHVKWLHFRPITGIETVSATNIPANMGGLPSNGLDYDFDGIVGTATTVD